MNEIKDLIVTLMEAEAKYSNKLTEVETRWKRDLLRDACKRKVLFKKELSRLFGVEVNSSTLESGRQKGSTDQFASYPVKSLIEETELKIKEKYESILEENEFGHVESFVLKNHLKNQRSLLKDLQQVNSTY
ncbi:hypothetical protein [Algoriphagus sediminis]|uniref:DUF2383 domain-containing protein n=1 Tax=Algoriphagus sediminis TaxID=3057113 RepID=A0ABT7YFD5_9BACT|nr:hypothetical protein [Algoriphagus sediminis]MDN3205234.1 hypothetical protein [Algoriphagus sediminis]